MPARLRTLYAWLLPRGPLDVMRQVLLFATAYYAYRIVRGHVDAAARPRRSSNAREVIGIEQALGTLRRAGVQAWTERVRAQDFATGCT